MPDHSRDIPRRVAVCVIIIIPIIIGRQKMTTMRN